MRVATVAATAAASVAAATWSMDATHLLNEGSKCEMSLLKPVTLYGVPTHTTVDLAINANEKNIRISVNKSSVLLLFGTHTIEGMCSFVSMYGFGMNVNFSGSFS